MTPTRSFAGMALAARLISAAVVITTLAGCHTLPPLRYYALQAVPPASSAPAPAATPPLIRIRHVGVPHEMDHLGLTHRQGATQLVIEDSDRWSAPLADLIQGTLTRDLGARLGFEHVVASDALLAHGTAPAALDLDFVALSADDTCAVTAQVNWTLSGADMATRRGSIPLTATANGCPAGLAGALSTALGELADQLAGRLAAP